MLKFVTGRKKGAAVALDVMEADTVCAINRKAIAGAPVEAFLVLDTAQTLEEGLEKRRAIKGLLKGNEKGGVETQGGEGVGINSRQN